MSNPADCTIGASVQVKKYTTWLNMNLIYWQWFIFNHVVYFFTCTEAPIVESAGFDIFYLIYWQWFIFNHDVYVFTCTEAPIVESAGFDLWIIGLVLGIIVLIIVVFFICTVYRKRGGECPGKWSSRCLCTSKKIYNMVKYESLSVYQIKNVKSCWLYYRCLCTSKKIYNMVKYESLSVYQIKNITNPADCTTGAYRGTCSTVSRIWYFIFDILTMIHI
jgi:hypothetical protein